MRSIGRGVVGQGGGRARARRLAVVMAVVLCSSTFLVASDVPRPAPAVRVTERDGVYRVAATFSVPQPSAVVYAALTDYTAIPRFMPEVRTSTVLERDGERVVVEQEAIARFMMFSKRLHLVLDVEQERGLIRFRDRCGRSFSRYEGTWTVAEKADQTQLTYELTAQPSFEVPGFLLRRLLERDATRMIERLSAEIEARARPTVN